jgi:hypothetical protein
LEEFAPMTSGSNTVAAIALVLAIASLGISVWQAVLRWREFGDRRKARIAVDVGEIILRSDHEQWEVELWLTNVGLSHARRVRAWLEDADGAVLSDECRVRHPLISGAESQSVRVTVPRKGRSTVIARPVRRWRDGRDVSLKPDPSDQRIRLDSRGGAVLKADG